MDDALAPGEAPGEADLPDGLYRKLAELLEAKTGISLKRYKKYLIVHRLSKLVGENRRYADFESFYKALVGAESASLLPQFINALTTNYSYFFRDPVHFGVLREYLEGPALEERSVRLWSAASSTGEEAYSMAITALDGPAATHPDLKILASDISGKVLELARRGVFPAEHVEKEMRSADVKRWFKPSPDGRDLEVCPQVRGLVAFRYLNLLDPFPFSRPMDVVFLRNVLIYFGKEGKEGVLEKVWHCLKPNGLLIVGLSESLVGVQHRFAMGKNSVYRKA